MLKKLTGDKSLAASLEPVAGSNLNLRLPCSDYRIHLPHIMAPYISGCSLLYIDSYSFIFPLVINSYLPFS